MKALVKFFLGGALVMLALGSRNPYDQVAAGFVVIAGFVVMFSRKSPQ